MNNKKLQLFAKDIIKEKLGFEVSSTRIDLLESAENGDAVEYLLFRRRAIKHIEYAARLEKGKYTLEIFNTANDTEIYFD